MQQVFKAMREGKHAIAVREFRYDLTDDEAQLERLIAKLARCADAHVVKLLGCARIPGRSSSQASSTVLRFCCGTQQHDLCAMRRATSDVHPSPPLSPRSLLQHVCSSPAGHGSGSFIAVPLFEGGSLKDKLAGPKAGEMLWYRKCVFHASSLA